MVLKVAQSNPEFVRLLKAELSKEGKVFPNSDALKEYLKKHPKADPSKHTVRGKGDKDEKPKGGKKPKKDEKPKGDKKPKKDDKKKPSKKKDLSKEEGFSALKGMSNAEQRKVIERALAMEMGEKPKKDVSKQEGFEELKDLTPNEQKKVIERALKQEEKAREKMASAALKIAKENPEFRRLLIAKLKSEG